MKVLFVDSNDQERDQLVLQIESAFSDARVIEAISLANVKNHFENKEKIDLIICTDSIADSTPGEIYNFIKENQASIHFVFLSQNKPDSVRGMENFYQKDLKNSFIQLPVSPNTFVASLKEIIRPASFKIDPVPAFTKIKLINFYRFNQVLCDVFIQLSDRKYVKVINKNNIYAKIDIDHLKSKAIDYLYISTKDFEKFSSSFNKTAFLILNHDNIAPSFLEEALATTHSMLREHAINFGIGQHAVEATIKCSQEMVKLFQKNSSAVELFNKMKYQQNYIYNHSLLTGMVCSQIASKIKRLTEYDSNKLRIASLLHDITILNPEMAEYEDHNDPRLNKFTKKEQKNFLYHPLDIATKIKESELVDEDIFCILKEHHEKPDGSGFPGCLKDEQIHALSRIFIIAHEYVTKMYVFDFNQESHPSILEYLKSVYKGPNFSEILNSL